MKQKLLLLLICLLGISNINAQVTAIHVNDSRQLAGDQLRTATAGSTLFLGYCDDGNALNVGSSTNKTLSAAICLPPTFLGGIFTGTKITKISFLIMGYRPENVSVWIRNTLTGADLVSAKYGNVTSDGWKEITLPTPVEMTGDSLFIGLTGTGTYFLTFSRPAVYDGCWFEESDGWYNYADQNWGSYCIRVGVESDEDIIAAAPASMPKLFTALEGENFSITANVKSYSTVDITSLKVSCQINSGTAIERTISVDPISPGKNADISIPIDAITTAGTYPLTNVKILEVNGMPNSSAFVNKTLASEIRVVKKIFPRKVVMEEGTGTWCGWCIRGTVGMAMMKEKYPDTFIGIAVHNRDDMTVTTYDNYMVSNFFTNGFPEAVVNRKADLIGDPYYEAENFYQSEMALAPVAGIKLSGGFDVTKTAIALKTVTTFGISFNNANYKLAYVLIEDGVTGYSQQNYYSGGGNGTMGGYETKPSVITDMVFDDVARGIYSYPTGISGSIPASITEMTPVESAYTINLPSAIRNKGNLAVAVMLINGATGEIENADITGIGIIGQGIPVTGVKPNRTAVALISGSTLQLKATVAPTYATNKKVTWSSSNQTVASVDDTGKVTALAGGTATITVTTEDGNKTAACEVKVIARCDNLIASGTTGDLSWMLCPDGTLTIIGQGIMPDYNYNDQPWNSYLSSITFVVIKDGVINIGSGAFYGCTNLTSVTIPNSVTSIGNYAFYDCSGLTSVTIPNSVTSIGNYAFYDCSGLTSVTIPNSVTSIGTYAFYNCSGLTSVTIPSSVTSIVISAFTNCTGVTAIDVDNANPSYSSENGVLFDKGKKTLICFPAGKSGSYAIPNSVITIANYSFYDCTGLTSVTIPRSVTKIGNYAFYDCTGLTSVTCYAVKPPTLGVSQDGNIYTFDNVNLPNCILYVPTGSKALYEAAEVWKDFGSIIEVIPTGIVLPPASAAANVYVSNRNLTIESNAAETIDIYSANGIKVFTSTKNQGIITVSCGNFPEGILIVKGSSGWVKKVIYNKK